MPLPFTSGALGIASVLALSLSLSTAWADSTSSASSAASGSVGSSSASLETSSDSASSSSQRVAQGPYTVVDMAAVPLQPHLVQLRLQAQNMPPTHAKTAHTGFTLRLPREAAQQAQLALGHTVVAQHRPYGLALATPLPDGQTRPFFLVMDGDGHRDLAIRAVGG